MSKRSELAKRLADFINENNLAQVLGGDVTQDDNRKGKPYVIMFSKLRNLDGVVTVFSEKFIHVKYRTRYGNVPQDGSYVFESEENVVKFLRLAFIELDDKAMEVPMKDWE